MLESYQLLKSNEQYNEEVAIHFQLLYSNEQYNEEAASHFQLLLTIIGYFQ